MSKKTFLPTVHMRITQMDIIRFKIHTTISITP